MLMTHAIRRMKGRYDALGIAAHYLAAREPFRSFRFGDLIATIDGQIRRRHYLMAFAGPKVEGYLGWALFDAAVAARFARTGVPPPDEFADGKDVVWLLTAAAGDPATLRLMIRVGRGLYPGLRVMGVRHRANGKTVLFDRQNRSPAANGSAEP
jgi:hypothetical protein